jgi:hypothetical protein
MNVSPGAIEGLTEVFLKPQYDNPKQIPDLHREMWEEFCSDHSKVAIAAPRGHAKSTAISHAAILACMLTKEKSFCLLVSDTEAQAAEFLGDIKAELTGNSALRDYFDVKRIVKDTETNIIVQFKDGEMFRVIAKGSMQKVRGLKWRGKRPDLIVGDDLENDEIVMNPERREKFRRWFMNALIPCGSDSCSVRIVGTILHLDSMLQRLLDDPTWRTKVYEAHNHDFSEILWPQQFPEERLKSIRAGYDAQNDLDGYSQEYLNKPVATGNSYFNPDYFYDFERDKKDKWIKPNLEYYAAADFAISEKEKADYTVIMVAGVDPDGTVYLVDVKKFRGDADMIINELIATEKHYHPNVFTFETEKLRPTSYLVWNRPQIVCPNRAASSTLCVGWHELGHAR